MFLLLLHVCASVCVCGFVGVCASSECQNVVMCDRCAIVHVFVCVFVGMCVWSCLRAITEDNRTLGNARLQGQRPLFY